MSDLKINLSLIFNPTFGLIIEPEIFWQDTHISSELSVLMQFLYQYEKTMKKEDLDFLYRMAKGLKKTKMQDRFIIAIMQDVDQFLFFNQALTHNIPLYIKEKDTVSRIRFNEKFPIEYDLSATSQGIEIRLKNRKHILNTPLMWHPFQLDNQQLILSQNVVNKSVSDTVYTFVMNSMEKEKVRYYGEDATQFVNQTLKILSPLFDWNIHGSLESFIIRQAPIAPILELHYDNKMLNPQLSFRYGTLKIPGNSTDDVLIDPKTKKRYERDTKTEAKYQNDLFTQFDTHHLPFMLNYPPDIVKFLNVIVPNLKSQGWEISGNQPAIHVNEEPIDIEFSIQNSTKDWFQFEPNWEFNGTKLSLMETARLMVENHGYIHTASGFTKISSKSQEELKLLQKLKAFQSDQQFNRAQILSLITATQTKGNDAQSQELVKSCKNVYELKKPPRLDELQATLRTYQHYGVHWMLFLYQLRMGGLLADDMGLGKTVQAIAFILQLPKDNPVLIIGPTNVIYNWKQECEKFAPSLKVHVHSGASRNINELTQNDIIVTSFGIMKNDLEFFKSVHYEAIIIDEAQAIKNPKSQISQAVKSLRAEFRLAMTGTPIENHFQDLWNLFDFIMPDFLGNQRNFDIAVKEGNKSLLKTKIRPYILRREKKEVLDALPDKTEIIIKCPLSDEQKSIYQTVLDITRKGIRDSQGKINKLNILTALLKLRQICAHPSLLKEFQSQNVPSSKFDTVTEKLTDLILEGHKVVLFSQFTGMLDILETWVKEQNMMMERIDGSITGQARLAAVNRFQSSTDAGVFLISLKAGGVGLNLTSADYVIHMDPWWNPAIENQATDRVHRMGQTNKVIVYKLVAEGTIEEKINELQDEKRQLLGQIIDIDASEESTINVEEILQLI